MEFDRLLSLLRIMVSHYNPRSSTFLPIIYSIKLSSDSRCFSHQLPGFLLQLFLDQNYNYTAGNNLPKQPLLFNALLLARGCLQGFVGTLQ